MSEENEFTWTVKADLPDGQRYDAAWPGWTANFGWWAALFQQGMQSRCSLMSLRPTLGRLAPHCLIPSSEAAWSCWMERYISCIVMAAQSALCSGTGRGRSWLMGAWPRRAAPRSLASHGVSQVPLARQTKARPCVRNSAPLDPPAPPLSRSPRAAARARAPSRARRHARRARARPKFFPRSAAHRARDRLHRDRDRLGARVGHGRELLGGHVVRAARHRDHRLRRVGAAGRARGPRLRARRPPRAPRPRAAARRASCGRPRTRRRTCASRRRPRRSRRPTARRRARAAAAVVRGEHRGRAAARSASSSSAPDVPPIDAETASAASSAKAGALAGNAPAKASRSLRAPRAIVMPQSPSPATWSHAVSCGSAGLDRVARARDRRAEPRALGVAERGRRGRARAVRVGARDRRRGDDDAVARAGRRRRPRERAGRRVEPREQRVRAARRRVGAVEREHREREARHLERGDEVARVDALDAHARGGERGQSAARATTARASAGVPPSPLTSRHARARPRAAGTSWAAA